MKAWLQIPEEVWEAHPNIDHALRYDWPCRDMYRHGGMRHILMADCDCREMVVRSMVGVTNALTDNGIDLEDATVNVIGINMSGDSFSPSLSVDTVFEATSHSVRSIVSGVLDRHSYVTTVCDTLTRMSGYRYHELNIRERYLGYPTCYQDFPAEPSFHYTPVLGKRAGEIIGIPATWCASASIMSHILYFVRMWCSAYETHSGALVHVPVAGITDGIIYQDQKYNGVNSIFISMLRDFGPTTYLARYGAGWWAFLYAMLVSIHNQVELPFFDNDGVDGFMTWLDENYIGELVQPVELLLELGYPPITLGYVD